MAALAASVPPPKWIPEDDLLLKNAIEAGASLEALAKGAVRFSRKFTVRELRERWHSLLYDPVISAEASAGMLDLELSAPNYSAKVNKFGVPIPKENSGISAKRKIESVRRLYYAMRKKIRSRVCDSPDVDFLGSPEGGESLGFDRELKSGSCEFGHRNRDSLALARKELYSALRVEFPSLEGEGNNARNDGQQVLAERLTDLRDGKKVDELAQHRVRESNVHFHAEGSSSPLPGMPLWKTMEDVSAPEMPIHASVEDEGQMKEEPLVHQDDLDGRKIGLSGLSVVHSGEMLEGDHGEDVLNNPTAISGCDFGILSDSLLNLENEDIPLFMDIDVKDTIDSSSYDNVNSLLVSSTHDVQDDIACVKEPQLLVSDTSLQVPSEACPVKFEVIAESSVSVNGDQHTPILAEKHAPSSVSTPNLCAQHGEMVCVLNTEDSDIPCNSNDLSAEEFVSVRETTFINGCHLSSSSAIETKGSQELILLKKEDNTEQSLSASQMVERVIFPVTSPNHLPVRGGFKCKSSDVICPSVFTRQTSIAHAGPSQCSSLQATLTSARGGAQKAESLRACGTRDISLHAEGSSAGEEISVPEAELSTLYHEELESDDDIPYFSDIEAMILEMDLSADVSDSCVKGEVSKYQNEDAKRKIMRLEQCARSSTERAIASRGALAILYGRHLKHYIKKTEVMLGRATDDMDVDIDLRREGPANKISRRQALIKMEGDCSFSLKNLGKVPVFLNGKEIATGQSSSLKSSSLIEIRGMAFVFEVNSQSVRQYVANVSKRQRENNFKFEWSEGAVNCQGKIIKLEQSA